MPHSNVTGACAQALLAALLCTACRLLRPAGYTYSRCPYSSWTPGLPGGCAPPQSPCCRMLAADAVVTLVA